MWFAGRCAGDGRIPVVKVVMYWRDGRRRLTVLATVLLDWWIGDRVVGTGLVACGRRAGAFSQDLEAGRYCACSDGDRDAHISYPDPMQPWLKHQYFLGVQDNRFK